VANKSHQQVPSPVKHQQMMKAKSDKNMSSGLGQRKEAPITRILKSTPKLTGNNQISSDEDDWSKMTTTYNGNSHSERGVVNSRVGHHPQHQIIIKQIHLKKQAKSMQDTSKLSQPTRPVVSTTTTKLLAANNGRKIVAEKLTGGSANVYKPPAPVLVQSNRKSVNETAMNPSENQVMDAKKYLLNYNNFGEFLLRICG
jgi:hypothetical protein